MSILLSPHELAHCIIRAGFRTTKVTGETDAPAVTMLAICLAEDAAKTLRGSGTGLLSRSNTGAHVGNWDHGVGQISGKFHADKIIAEGGNWRDPYASMRICKRIYDDAGQKFTPWNVTDTGAQVEYLPDARLAITKPWPCPDLEWRP